MIARNLPIRLLMYPRWFLQEETNALLLRSSSFLADKSGKNNGSVSIHDTSVNWSSIFLNGMLQMSYCYTNDIHIDVILSQFRNKIREPNYFNNHPKQSGSMLTLSVSVGVRARDWMICEMGVSGFNFR